MMCQPRKIRDLDLRTCRQEQEHVKDMLNGKWPVFNIKLKDSTEKGSSQKSSIETF